jgi:hypothetical protein
MKIRDRFAVVALLMAAVLAIFSMGASAATKSVVVNVKCVTGTPVPVSLTMDEVREAIGVDFPANWDSLTVLDEKGEQVPFQLDDVDMSGTVSRYDEVAFLATGPVKIVVSDEEPEKKPVFQATFGVDKVDEDNTIIYSLDGLFKVKVGKYGTLDIIEYRGKEHKYARDIGMIRYAGFPYSTWWYDENYDRHEEKTTFEEPFRIIKLGILEAGPARITVVAHNASDLFPGMRQEMVASIYTTGEIRVSNRVVSAGYADLTKLFTMCGGVMSDIEDARHILPVFRWIDWADELGITAKEYWAEQGALTEVDGTPYITFADSVGPKPAWWGASYLFCSPERWRTNFSAGESMGVAECLMDVPEVAPDLEGKIEMEHWHLEGEWRTGYFRWIADEIFGLRQKNEIPINIENLEGRGPNWPLHMIPGDVFEHLNYYLIYDTHSVASTVRYLEARYAELDSVEVK